MKKQHYYPHIKIRTTSLEETLKEKNIEEEHWVDKKSAFKMYLMYSSALYHSLDDISMEDKSILLLIFKFTFIFKLFRSKTLF